ncbi:MAG TPA: DUF1214 domain-containing protein [Actinomycetota bacterium]|nr:DUF1214 domain-containing protein [Actinomycetota bacterium]
MAIDAAGAAWEDFCRRLAELGTTLPDDPADPGARADGVRHLARQAVMALQGHFEHGDPGHPSFHRYEEPWVQWGGPNPDNVYLRAPIDPAATYRLWGDVTGVREAIISLVEGDMHLGAFGVWSEKTLSELAVGPDGALEVWISPDEHEGNWLPTDPGATQLLVRQYQVDWEQDRVATLHLERLDTRGTPPPALTDTAVAAALGRAAAWVEASASFWSDYMEGARAGMAHNAFGPPTTPPGGAPNIAYGGGWWELGPGEALVITHDVPDADYWGWTVHHRHRMDSGDFANRLTSTNGAQAHVDGDGQVRLVLAAADPGTANWIDTEGRPEGLLVYRYVGTRTRPVPEAEVVKLSLATDHLPRDHPAVTPEARVEQLAARRRAILARYQ